MHYEERFQQITSEENDYKERLLLLKEMASEVNNKAKPKMPKNQVPKGRKKYTGG